MSTHEDLLNWRGIPPDQYCERCSGSGYIVYGSTATWRGGIGGAAMTNDVCNACWGSGNRHRPWANLKRVSAQTKTLQTITGKYAP
jgi:hypothetical protein